MANEQGRERAADRAIIGQPFAFNKDYPSTYKQKLGQKEGSIPCYRHVGPGVVLSQTEGMNEARTDLFLHERMQANMSEISD